MDRAPKLTGNWTYKTELRMAVLSLLLGGLLMSAKLIAYYLTKSTAIFSDAMENIVNVLSSWFAIYALRLAHRPADQDHPYGHGKVEFLSATFEGGMILLATLLIVVRAGESLALEQVPEQLRLGVMVAGGSAVLCAAVGWLLWRYGGRAGSMTLEAEGVHLLSDAVTGTAVMFGLLAVHFTHLAWIDAVAALVVSGWITFQAVRLLRRAAAGLMDEQDAADTVLLKRILDSHVGPHALEPRICGYHKLRHRHSGRMHWVDFHVQVPAGWPVEQGHRVATHIQMEIQNSLHESTATAHIEPCGDMNCAFCHQAELAATRNS